MKKGKNTFASVAEELARKEAKYQKLLDGAGSTAQKTSAKLMLQRVSEAREQLMADNRSQAEQMQAPSAFKYGGNVPKYEYGTDIDPTKPKLDANGNPIDPRYYPSVAQQVGAPLPGYLNFTPPPVTQAPKRGAGTVKSARAARAPRVPQESINHLPTPEITPWGTELNVPTQELLSSPQYAQDPTMMQKLLYKNEGLGDKAMGAAGMVAPFIDNLSFGKYVDSVKRDAAPELAQHTGMETEFNINPQLAEARQGQRILNRSLDSSNTSRGVANNAKVAGYADRLRSTGALYGQKQNIETRLKNQNSQMADRVANQNKRTLNQHRQDNVDFDNQKEAMKYANKVNISEDIGNIYGQYLTKKQQKAQLKALEPYLNRYGMVDKYWAEQFGIPEGPPPEYDTSALLNPKKKK